MPRVFNNRKAAVFNVFFETARHIKGCFTVVFAENDKRSVFYQRQQPVKRFPHDFNEAFFHHVVKREIIGRIKPRKFFLFNEPPKNGKFRLFYRFFQAVSYRLPKTLLKNLFRP